MNTTAPEDIQYARLPDGIVVIRIRGKGSHQNSPALRYIFHITRNADAQARYVFDLDGCSTMDSTFMGTLASIGIHQRKSSDTTAIIINMDSHVRRLLDTLGLKFIFDLRASGTPLPRHEGPGAFQSVETPQMTKLERTVMMLEAHEQLIDLDSRNEVQFHGVVKSLRESLAREQDRHQ